MCKWYKVFDDVPRVPLVQTTRDVAMQQNVDGYTYVFHLGLNLRSIYKKCWVRHGNSRGPRSLKPTFRCARAQAPARAPRSAVTAKSMSGALTTPRGFRAHRPLIAPQTLGAAVVLSGVVARRPGYVVPADQPVLNDRLTFCMMVPHPSDNRCASALAISTRCNMHS
jgi:hypothetical protein